ncbi:Uncharacterized protein HZ326_31666 [Fusarium oxysporum f. sp. albedinis]|nr:Uncharacterized protein HZ326_31666 [Fusarium oxysporum f. sp. albedinis]
MIHNNDPQDDLSDCNKDGMVSPPGSNVSSKRNSNGEHTIHPPGKVHDCFGGTAGLGIRQLLVNKGRNHYIHSTLGPSRVDVRFLGNYKVDVAHIRPEWNGCTHVDL